MSPSDFIPRTTYRTTSVKFAAAAKHCCLARLRGQHTGKSQHIIVNHHWLSQSISSIVKHCCQQHTLYPAGCSDQHMSVLETQFVGAPLRPCQRQTTSAATTLVNTRPVHATPMATSHRPHCSSRCASVLAVPAAVAASVAPAAVRLGRPSSPSTCSKHQHASAQLKLSPQTSTC